MSKPNETNSSAASSGIGFWGLLQIVFITLKLLNVIEWSWWWVLSPTWISVTLFVFLVVIFLAVAAAMNDGNFKNLK